MKTLPENNDRYWWNCGSSRAAGIIDDTHVLLTHPAAAICGHYIHTWYPYVRLYIRPSVKQNNVKTKTRHKAT